MATVSILDSLAARLHEAQTQIVFSQQHSFLLLVFWDILLCCYANVSSYSTPAGHSHLILKMLTHSQNEVSAFHHLFHHLSTTFLICHIVFIYVLMFSSGTCSEAGSQSSPQSSSGRLVTKQTRSSRICTKTCTNTRSTGVKCESASAVL